MDNWNDEKKRLYNYWAYSTLILALGDLDMASKALLERRSVVGHGFLLQKSTTWTTMEPPLQGRLGPLMHRIWYLLPHAAPLSHNPSLTAMKYPSSGNWSWSSPLHLVASLTQETAENLSSYMWNEVLYVYVTWLYSLQNNTFDMISCIVFITQQFL